MGSPLDLGLFVPSLFNAADVEECFLFKLEVDAEAVEVSLLVAEMTWETDDEWAVLLFRLVLQY